MATSDETRIRVSGVEVLTVREVGSGYVYLGICDDTGREFAHAHPNGEQCDALIAAIGRALGRPPGGNAARIVNAIVADLSDRRGLRHEWDGIDDDIRAEIVAKWTRIVEDGMGAREQQ